MAVAAMVVATELCTREDGARQGFYSRVHHGEGGSVQESSHSMDHNMAIGCGDVRAGGDQW
jgi:hypothetical protein